MSSSLGLRLPSWAMFKKKRSADISALDSSYDVTYLGNVLTGWAKGEGCAKKPLGTLWKNYANSEKPHIYMKVTICSSGLCATTREHGLTEYLPNRITYCQADPTYPKVFCWIYRHDGRKMKQELRCHAILCRSERKAQDMAVKLKDRIRQAFIDFKKERISRQNARLSLANSGDTGTTVPLRKILLQNGSENYRAPIEKSKTAPKLHAIEEVSPDIEEAEEKFYDSSFEDDDEILQKVEMGIDSVFDVGQRNYHHSHFMEHDSNGAEDPTSSPLYQKLRAEMNSSPSDDEDEVTDHLVNGNVEETSRDIKKITADDQDAISDESGYAEDPVRYICNMGPSSSEEDEEDEEDDSSASSTTSSVPSSLLDDKKPRTSFVLSLGDRKPYQRNSTLVPEFCINI
ncbi:uncharacterized protein [Lepeophtheirus salmonis]|nr:protein FAM43A-like isoform X2 [Lepeophtheirus salmonis]XP_040580636.1 protein FAM43A-like isoform X2 [Lepeophtheirus salmonis]XP_040580637.1 protein FAM43A-like isoform X2 [Lepeophtheirus salmonis]